MVWGRIAYDLDRLPGPMRADMVRRLLALDPARKKPADEVARAHAIASDTKAVGKAFGALSEVAQTIVAALSHGMVRADLATRVLARHGAALDDDADRALAKHFGAVLEQWPAVSDNGFAFRAHVRLVEPLSTTVAALPLVAEARFTVPREAGRQTSGREVVSPLALVLVPGMLLQRGRLTAGRDVHGTVAKKLAAILPRIEAHARAWIGQRAIDRDEGGMPRLDLARAKRVVDSLSGVTMIEHLAGTYVDEHERAMIAVSAMADEGDTLDLLALMEATTTPSMRLERPFSVLDVEVAENAARLPVAVHRIVRGDTTASGQRSFVQPDFEVVLSDAASLSDAMIIGCAAELEHFGTVARLRLTKLALQKARVNGITKEMVVEALERASGKALPPNVATALSEWSGAVGTGSLRESIVLALDGDAGQLDRAARVLEPITTRRPEAGLFLLSAMPKSKHLEQLRSIGLHVTSEIEAARVRELSAASTYAYEPSGEEPETYAPSPKPKQRPDVRFVDEGFRRVDPRKVLEWKRIERFLQRSVPPQRPSAVTIAEDTRPPPYVYEEVDYDDEDEPLTLVQQAFDACRERFAHRRDWVIELEGIEDLDATRSLQIAAPEALCELLRTAPSPAMLRLFIVNAAERMLVTRSK
jgi:hypothetical protein